MKLKFGIKGLLIVLVICLSLISTILTLNEVKIAKVITQEQNEKKKRTKTRQVPPMIRNANDTLTNATYRDLNGSVNPSHLNDFKEARRKWDFKLIDSQISDIFEMMHKPSVQYKTAADDRAFLEIFFNEFYNYDANKDNQWDIAELTVAFKNDTYISKLLPPPEIFAVNKKYANAEDFYQKIDIHIHAPEGAIPKDGPSAGLCMATALTSALTGRPINRNVAMTGEITLRGRALPIGGLKEKALAAHRAGITRVLFPSENLKDLSDIPKSVRRDIEFIPVDHMDEVLLHSLTWKEKNKRLV